MWRATSCADTEIAAFAVRLPSCLRIVVLSFLGPDMTDAPDTQTPSDTGSICLDFKLFATWQLSLMALGMLARAHLFDEIAAPVFYGALLVYFLALLFVAVHHRRKHNWRWPGVDDDAVQHTLVVAGGACVFMVIGWHGMPPLTRAGVPTNLFAVSLFAFAILYAMNIAQWGQAQFDACCGETETSTDSDEEPRWMRFVRGTWLTALALTVADVAASMFVDITVKQNAAAVRDALHTVLLDDHGRHFWLTPQQSDLFHALMQSAGFTVPAVLLSGVFLRNVLGVKLFPFLDGMSALFARKNSE
jgi:hypothetical protein